MIIKKTLSLLFYLIPLSIFGQEIPMEYIESFGFTELEITETHQLKGNNGFENKFLIYRMELKKHPKVLGIYDGKYALSFIDTNKELKYIIPWQTDFLNVEYYQFNQNKLMILFTDLIFNRQLKILVIDLDSLEIENQIYGEVPCSRREMCSWLNEKAGKFAFLVSSNLNDELVTNSIYEYDFQTNKIRLVKDNLQITLDAWNITANLQDIIFNSQLNAFEYNP